MAVRAMADVKGGRGGGVVGDGDMFEAVRDTCRRTLGAQIIRAKPKG